MKAKVNYRAERAERARKKAEKKEARLTSLSRKPEEAAATDIASGTDGSTPNVHRFSD